MSAAHTPGPWELVYVKNRAGARRIGVARKIGGELEYVCSASGKTSTFCTEAGAKAARRAAIAKDTDPHANGCPDSPGICECFRTKATKGQQ